MTQLGQVYKLKKRIEGDGDEDAFPGKFFCSCRFVEILDHRVF